ncbi:MAG: WxL domain-containing protein, partial [Acidimicrobiia bacterium]
TSDELVSREDERSPKSNLATTVMEDHIMKKRKLASAAAIALAGTLIATTAHAAPGDLVVTAGPLDFDPAGAPTLGTFAAITLNGQPQLTRAQLPTFTIIDSRGDSSGWAVSLTVSDLVNGASTIAATQMSMTAATVIDNSTGAAAASVTGNAVASFTAGSNTIVTATAAATSNGTFLVSPQLIKLVVPANALAGTYASTATLSVA